jgi:alpha-amylase
MAVIMQAFYWDAPKKEDKRGEWWNNLAAKIPPIGSFGI